MLALTVSMRVTVLFSLILTLSCASEPPAVSEPPAAAETQLPLARAPRTLLSLVFTEGPAVAPSGEVYFSEITGNRILKYTPGRADWTEFRNPSGKANGLAFDSQGRLIACEGGWEGGNRRVTRTDLDTGKIETLAESFEGKRLNSPNDLAVAKDGRVYFTDPRYGSQDGRELDTEDVYLIRPTGELVRVATAPEVRKPNGIVFSPDEKTLYVADTQPGPPSEARVMKFDVAGDGTLSNPRVHYSFGEGRGIDGMAVDSQGRIYGAAGRTNGLPENPAGVYVIGPRGDLQSIIPVPEDSATNCTLTPDGDTLYITAGKLLLEHALQ